MTPNRGAPLTESDPRNFRLGSLSRRVLLAFVGVSLVPIVLTALLSYRQSSALIEDYLGETVTKTARAYAADLDLFLQQRRSVLRQIPPFSPGTDLVLSSAVAADPNLVALLFMNTAGQLLAHGGDVDPWAEDACRALLQHPTQAMTHAGAGHAHEVIIAVSRDTGLLCGQVSFTLHQAMLSERAHSIVGGTAYILDASGTVVCHAFEEHEPHVSTGDSLHELAAVVARDAKLWSGLSTGEDGGESFASFAPSATLPWGVWVEVSRAQATAPLRAALTQSLAYSGGLALLSLALAVVLVRKLISPIEDVVAAVGGITKGQYGEAIPVRGEDEVAELARAFNQMSVAVQRSHTELDDRVVQRTRQLQTAVEFSDLMFNTLGERILVIDSDLKIVRANHAALNAYGRDLVGTACARLHPAEGTHSAQCTAAKVLKSGRPHTEERTHRQDGFTEILAVNTSPILGDDGQPEAVVEIARDITELKRIQARLIHQEKMASVGALAAGLAHEIGNPLASMSSELEMLERMWDPEEARQSLPILRDQVQRISRLLREMVAFGRPSNDIPRAVKASTVVREVARLLRHDPRSRGVIVEVSEPLTDATCANRDRMVQVLVNLGLNALDAVDGRGQVRLSATTQAHGELRFEVHDTGTGLTAAVLHQVFDPFFTTKDPGSGTGLGLFVSERIVAGLGGRIEVRSMPNQGSTFTVFLPPATEASP